MFQERYRSEMDAAGPSRGQMERLLAAIQAQPERPAGGDRAILRRVLVMAAVCAGLVLTVLAASPGLRETLASALGLFQPYSQEIEGLSAVDQGIEVRVVSALTDGNVARVYYEIQDLTGDRLKDDSIYVSNDFLIPVNWGEEDGPRWVSAGSTSVGGPVDYDPSTKTALMVTEVLGEGPPAEKLILRLDIEKIQPGYAYVRSTADPAWIAQETLKAETVEDGKSVLAPNQNPRPLDSDYFSLSSFGFGEDGVLHFQVKVKVDDSEWADCDVSYSGGVSRSETPQDPSRSNRYCQAGADWPAPLTRFQRDGITYYDVRTGITPADVAEGDVEWFDWFGAFLRTRPAIRGNWSLEVETQPVETTAVDMTGSQTVLGGVAAQTLHLSVLGCTIESVPQNDKAGTLGYPLTVYLADGRTLPKNDYDSAFHAGRYAVNHWTFPEPVEPGEVTAIAIGQWYVPIENGAALPGHWLDALPS